MNITKISRAFGAAAVLATGLSHPTIAATLVSDAAIDERVTLTAEATRDGAISSVVKNLSDKRVDEVIVLVRYDWLWKDDRNPGNDSPAWAEYVTIGDDIEAGASLPFTYRPRTPLPQRSDGHFMPRAELVGVRQYK